MCILVFVTLRLSVASIPNDFYTFQAGIWKTAYRFLILAFQVSVFFYQNFVLLIFCNNGKKSCFVAEWKAKSGAQRSLFLTWVLSPTGPTGRYLNFVFLCCFFVCLAFCSFHLRYVVGYRYFMNLKITKRSPVDANCPIFVLEKRN